MGDGFEEHVYSTAKKSIESIPEKLVGDIYALSFYYWADEDEPRRAMLTISYNTNDRWHACTPKPGQAPKWPIASDSDEAKWNYAFWLQEAGEICVIGEKNPDATRREQWIKSLKLWYSDEDEEEDFDRCIELGEQIMDRFVQLCASVAKRLHKEGVIKKKFGQPIPILVHELEYHEGIAQMTREANPSGLCSEFENWIKGM